MSAPTVTLNGQVVPIQPGCSLAEWLDGLGVAPQSVATAVNGQFVARDVRALWVLRAGDAVFTFQAITAG